MSDADDEIVRPLASYELDGWNQEMVGEYRLYWKLDRDAKWKSPTGEVGHGFEFKCFSWMSGTSYGPGETAVIYQNVWDDPGLKVENVLNGWAAFDGLRHIWFGEATRDGGYFNYPDSESMMRLMERISELEKEHCRDCKHNREKASRV